MVKKRIIDAETGADIRAVDVDQRPSLHAVKIRFVAENDSGARLGVPCSQGFSFLGGHDLT
jgi:hypothetical protein